MSKYIVRFIIETAVSCLDKDDAVDYAISQLWREKGETPPDYDEVEIEEV